MPINKIVFKPGINREGTSYSAEGTYYDCDKIRFRTGFAEKLGGWTNYSPNNVFIGVARTMLNWVDYLGYNLMAFGTNQKYYVESGGTYNDVTPIVSTTTLGTNPFSVTAGSPYVTVTASGSAAVIGSFVTISGAIAVGGLTLNGSYEIVGAPDANTFNIIASSNATSTATGGGSSVQVAYQLAAGSCVATTGLGWGVGGWGGISGVSSTAWGQSGSGAASFPLRLWSQCNFNQDLIINPRGGALYYWKDDQSFNRAVTLDAFIGSQTNISSGLTAKGIALTTVAASSTSTLIVDSSDYVSVGAYITASTGTVPSGTYVTAISYPAGTVQVSLNNAVGTSVTIPVGATITFSYAGKSVPTKVNRIFTSPIYQFTIAFGSTPYDPTNSNTTLNPMLIRWTDQANAYEWVPQTTNQAGEQIVNIGSSIITATYNRQEILVLTDAAIYSMQYVGPPYIFNFQLLQENTSIISPNAIITVNNISYWMGVDKFYIYTGRVETHTCLVRRYIFSNINMAQSDQIICGHNEGYNEIWWFYPSQNSTINDSYVVFNYLDNAWSYGSLDRTAWLDSPLRNYPMAAFSVQNTYLATAIDATTTSIPVLNAQSYPSSGGVIIGSEYITYTNIVNNTLTGIVGTSTPGCVRGATRPDGGTTTAASHSAYSTVTYVTPNQLLYHEYGLDDGSGTTAVPTATFPIYSFIDTADFGIGDGDRFAFVTRLLPDMSFTGSNTQIAPTPTAYLKLLPKQNSGSNYDYNVDTMTVVNTQLPDVPPAYTYPIEQYTGQVYTRIRGRQMSFRVYSNEKGVQWQLGNMRYDIRQDGRR